LDEKKELEVIKLWYDGYKFGETHIFNQFSVKNYLRRRVNDHTLPPEEFWVQTGSTRLIEEVVENFKDQQAINKFFENMQILLLGKSITCQLTNQLSYRQIAMKTIKIDDLWTLYFQTGYLTIDRSDQEATYFKIPNLEIQLAMLNHMNTILSLNKNDSIVIANAFMKKDFEQCFNKTEAFLSTFNARGIAKFFYQGKEGSYHLLFCLIFENLKGVSLSSEIYSGKGYYDIAVVPTEQQKHYKRDGKFNINF